MIMNTDIIRTGRWLLVIVLVALAFRLVSVLSLEPVVQWHDGEEYHRLAGSLFESRSYLSPEGRPTASWPPGYPVFLSLLGRKVLAVRLLQAFLGAITVLIAYSIARRYFGVRKSLLAATLLAIYPLHIYVAGVHYPVVLLTLLLGAIILMLLDTLEGGSLRKAFFAGLLGGIVALTAASSLLALVLAVVWLIWEGRRRWGRLSLRLGLVFLIPMVLVVGAWSIRNYIVLGSPVVVSTNGGYNFWIGNYPGTRATTGNREIPGRVEAELDLRATVSGEVEIERAFYRKGFEYIKAAPGRFITLTLAKALNFWRFYPEPLSRGLRSWEKIASILSYGLLLPFGLYWVVRNARGKAGVRLVIIFFITYTILHAIYISKVRFRLPLDMFLLIAAAGGIGDLAKRLNLRLLEP
ncbi:MAG: glycosyltransferase family 39 protein [bacterium]|nr:MAG: glycosyltransferase family 39 protein [bacterium]